MKAYFDRTSALFLTREPSYDAYPVEVPEEIVQFTEMVSALVAAIHLKAELAGAPEDSAQDLTDSFVEGMNLIARDLA